MHLPDTTPLHLPQIRGMILNKSSSVPKKVISLIPPFFLNGMLGQISPADTKTQCVLAAFCTEHFLLPERALTRSGHWWSTLLLQHLIYLVLLPAPCGSRQ